MNTLAESERQYTSYSAQYLADIAAGKANPFATLESQSECIQAMWGALAKMGISVWDTDEKGGYARPKGEVGSAVYYLNAIADQSQRIFQAMVALNHPLYDALENDNERAFELLKPELLRRAAARQADHDAAMRPRGRE
jgi:hypothetical protein